MKKRLLSALLGGVLLLSLGAAPSAGAPRSSQSLRAPNLGSNCWFHDHGNLNHHHIHCNIGLDIARLSLEDTQLDPLEQDLLKVVNRFVNRQK